MRDSSNRAKRAAEWKAQYAARKSTAARKTAVLLGRIFGWIAGAVAGHFTVMYLFQHHSDSFREGGPLIPFMVGLFWIVGAALGGILGAALMWTIMRLSELCTGKQPPVDPSPKEPEVRQDGE